MMLTLKITKPAVKQAGLKCYLRFDLEVWMMVAGSDVMLHRSTGWRVINGYISPPKSQTPKGYLAVQHWHPSVMNQLWEEIKPLYEHFRGKQPILDDLKECEMAVREGCIPDKLLEERGSVTA